MWLLCLVLGILMIVFNKFITRTILKSQEFFWGSWGTRFGTRNVKHGQIVVIIAGIGFIIFGLLSLLNIAQFK